MWAAPLPPGEIVTVCEAPMTAAETAAVCPSIVSVTTHLAGVGTGA